MASDLSSDFLAEGAHEEAPVEELERILDLYDRSVEDLPEDGEVVALEAREQFVVDFNSFRESRLRGALEEVAWRLVQRGHHAWLEDVGAESATEVVEIAGAAHSRPRPLVLCIVPAHREELRADPPRIAFIPDVERTRVDVRSDLGALGRPPRRIGRFSLDELDDGTIVDMTVQVIGSVLVGIVPVHSPPSPSPPPPDDHPASEWVQRLAEARRDEELAEAENEADRPGSS